MRLPLRLRLWFQILLEEEREKARAQAKMAYSKAFQRKVNPIAKIATSRPAPMRAFASVAAINTHITSAPKCGVRMNDYLMGRHAAQQHRTNPVNLLAFCWYLSWAVLTYWPFAGI